MCCFYFSCTIKTSHEAEKRVRRAELAALAVSQSQGNEGIQISSTGSVHSRASAPSSTFAHTQTPEARGVDHGAPP